MSKLVTRTEVLASVVVVSPPGQEMMYPVIQPVGASLAGWVQLSVSGRVVTTPVTASTPICRGDNILNKGPACIWPILTSEYLLR